MKRALLYLSLLVCSASGLFAKRPGDIINNIRTSIAKHDMPGYQKALGEYYKQVVAKAGTPAVREQFATRLVNNIIKPTMEKLSEAKQIELAQISVDTLSKIPGLKDALQNDILGKIAALPLDEAALKEFVEKSFQISDILNQIDKHPNNITNQQIEKNLVTILQQTAQHIANQALTPKDNQRILSFIFHDLTGSQIREMPTNLTNFSNRYRTTQVLYYYLSPNILQHLQNLQRNINTVRTTIKNSMKATRRQIEDILKQAETTFKTLQQAKYFLPRPNDHYVPSYWLIEATKEAILSYKLINTNKDQITKWITDEKLIEKTKNKNYTELKNFVNKTGATEEERYLRLLAVITAARNYFAQEYLGQVWSNDPLATEPTGYVQ